MLEQLQVAAVGAAAAADSGVRSAGAAGGAGWRRRAHSGDGSRPPRDGARGVAAGAADAAAGAAAASDAAAGGGGDGGGGGRADGRAVVSFITDELRAERHVRALLPWLDAALDLRLRPKGAVDLFGGAAGAALSRTLRGLSASAEESGVEAAKLYALVRGAGGGPPTPRPEWLVLD